MFLSTLDIRFSVLNVSSMFIRAHTPYPSFIISGVQHVSTPFRPIPPPLPSDPSHHLPTQFPQHLPPHRLLPIPPYVPTSTSTPNHVPTSTPTNFPIPPSTPPHFPPHLTPLPTRTGLNFGEGRDVKEKSFVNKLT